MNKKLWIVLGAAVLLVGGLVVHLTHQESPGSDFVESFFTPNLNGRYEKLQAAIASEESEEAINEAMKEYHSCIAPYVTEDVLEKMMFSRSMLRIDSYFEEKGGVWTIAEAEIVVDASNPPCRNYVILLSSGEESISIKGQMVLDESGTVETFYVDPWW